MEERYLIDTSAIIKYLNGTLPLSGLELMDKIFEYEPIISFVSEIELKVWDPLNPSDKEIYETFVNNSIVTGISQEIIDYTITVRKNYKLKLPDALIAATAIIYNYKLLADNDKDFGKIVELNYLNPSQLN